MTVFVLLWVVARCLLLLACIVGFLYAMTEARRDGVLRPYNIPACVTFLVPAFLVIYLWDIRWWLLLLVFGIVGLVVAVGMGILANHLAFHSKESTYEVE